MLLRKPNSLVAFYYFRELSRVEFEPNSKLRTIQKDAFTESKLASILIPASVAELEKECFLRAKKLSHIETEIFSIRMLMAIGESDIELIGILTLAHVTKIC